MARVLIVFLIFLSIGCAQKEASKETAVEELKGIQRQYRQGGVSNVDTSEQLSTPEGKAFQAYIKQIQDERAVFLKAKGDIDEYEIINSKRLSTKEGRAKSRKEIEVMSAARERLFTKFFDLAAVGPKALLPSEPPPVTVGLAQQDIKDLQAAYKELFALYGQVIDLAEKHSPHLGDDGVLIFKTGFEGYESALDKVEAQEKRIEQLLESLKKTWKVPEGLK